MDLREREEIGGRGRKGIEGGLEGGFERRLEGGLGCVLVVC